jgi:choice-of-anchor C domain-containing protein
MGSRHAASCSASVPAVLLILVAGSPGCCRVESPAGRTAPARTVAAGGIESARPIGPADLIEDGGFESPVTTTRTYDSYSRGGRLGAWLVAGGAVDLISHYFWKPAKGLQSIDLDGTCGAGTISQVVHPVPGRSYRLRFAVAGNPGGPPAVKSVAVWWGGTLVGSLSFDASTTSYRHMGWTYAEYTVTAASDAVELRFESLTPGCYGAALDDITLEEMESPPL